MIRTVDIQDKLLHLIGWEQSYDTSEIKISEGITGTESGMYFQQVHPLLTLQDLACVAPDFKNIEYPEYGPEKSYGKGMVVKYNEVLYKSVKDSQGVQPDSDEEYWVETNPFSEWLEGKTKASIQKSISRFCNEKIAQGTQKMLCENKVLFDGTGRLADTVKNRNNIVGFEIVPIRSKGVTTRINKIGLQFTKEGEYTLYLMHSSSFEPIRKITLTKTKANSLEWFSFSDLYLPYMGEATDAGGSWYLCYAQSELPEGSQAIKKDRDWSKGPCKSCSRSEYISWQAWSKYLEVHPFRVSEEALPILPSLDDGSIEVEMWDVEQNQYTYDTNYGINLEVTVECDITDFIIEQRFSFVDVISKQLAVDMLREFVYNPNVRTNRHSINASRVDIIEEIDGDKSSMQKSGLSYQLDKAFEALQIATDGMDRVCQPCKNNGIKYRTI